MLKVMSLLKRKEGMSFEDFRRWALEEHPEKAKAIPGLRKYTVNVLVSENDDLPADAVNELYFDDDDARVAAFASEAGKAAGGDATAHCSSRTHLLVQEAEQF